MKGRDTRAYYVNAMVAQFAQWCEKILPDDATALPHRRPRADKVQRQGQGFSGHMVDKTQGGHLCRISVRGPLALITQTQLYQNIPRNGHAQSPLTGVGRNAVVPVLRHGRARSRQRVARRNQKTQLYQHSVRSTRTITTERLRLQITTSKFTSSTCEGTLQHETATIMA